MSAFHSTKVTDGSIEGLWGAEHRRRKPTNGRQGKRPASGAAYVVGKIEDFSNITDTPCWRSLRFSQRNQCIMRHRSAPHRDFGVDIKVRIAVAPTREPVGARNPAILYGIGNILENAVDFARDTVEVNAWWNSENVEIVISDDGPGIAPDMLKRIGEPYVSRRPAADDGTRRGLGLGIFIARTLLERTGAKVSFSNRTFPDHGAVVQIVWPRSRFEAMEPADEPTA